MKPVLRPPVGIGSIEPSLQSAAGADLVTLDSAVWREALAAWRTAARTLAGYDGLSYDMPEFAWASNCFSLFVLNVWDEELRPQVKSPSRDSYQTAALLDRIESDYGGIDILLLWNGYPRIGLDDRDQFAFWYDLDEGLSGLRSVVDVCHTRGVRCAIPLLPWDTSTTPRGGSVASELCNLIEALDLDAVFLDTLSTGAADLRERVDAARPGVVFIPEVVPEVEDLAHHHLSWMQGNRVGPVPGVLRNKVFEQRHMQFEVRRWTPEHDDELQRAWLNGTGMAIWENVFGTWVGTSASFRSTLRQIRPVQKRFAVLLAEGRWSPMVETLEPGLFASSWTDGIVTFWAFANTTEREIAGDLLAVRLLPEDSVYDVLRGEMLDGSPANQLIHGIIPAGGVGGFVAGPPERLGEDWHEFLSLQAKERSSPEPPYPGVHQLRDPRSLGRRVHAGDNRSGSGLPEMVTVQPPRRVKLQMSYRVRECHFADELDRFHWREGKNTSRRFFREYEMGGYEISRTPITNAEYAVFLAKSSYEPVDTNRFLAHWIGGSPPQGQEMMPVTCISLEDAQAYAEWARARLPRIEEWQFAAEHWSQHMYTQTPPEGGVWELTANAYTDGHTRFVLLKGGSPYQATGSEWYMDGGVRPAGWIAKMIRVTPGIDRCNTVGFRIARSREELNPKGDENEQPTQLEP